jgi:hypothetical protein
VRVQLNATFAGRRRNVRNQANLKPETRNQNGRVPSGLRFCLLVWRPVGGSHAPFWFLVSGLPDRALASGFCLLVWQPVAASRVPFWFLVSGFCFAPADLVVDFCKFFV